MDEKETLTRELADQFDRAREAVTNGQLRVQDAQAELERAKAEYERVRVDLAAKLGLSTPTRQVRHTPVHRSVGKSSVTSRVLAAIDEVGGDVRAETIAKATDLDRAVVSQRLAGLTRDGTVQRVGRGTYRRVTSRGSEKR